VHGTGAETCAGRRRSRPRAFRGTARERARKRGKAADLLIREGSRNTDDRPIFPLIRNDAQPGYPLFAPGAVLATRLSGLGWSYLSVRKTWCAAARARAHRSTCDARSFSGLSRGERYYNVSSRFAAIRSRVGRDGFGEPKAQFHSPDAG
jgi:hypothetical protein